MNTPTKRISDPSFKYTPAIKTDIRKLFDRIREERAQAEALDRAGIKSIPIKRKQC